MIVMDCKSGKAAGVIRKRQAGLVFQIFTLKDSSVFGVDWAKVCFREGDYRGVMSM